MKYLVTVPALCCVLFALCLLKVGRVGATTYPVIASIAGVEINTTVDSDIAREILTGNLDALPAQTIAELGIELNCNSLEHLPDASKVRRLTSAFTVDAATALLARCLYQVPQIRHSQDMFLRQLSRYQNGLEQPVPQQYQKREDYVFLVVPGWGYEDSSAETGADLAKPREIVRALGFDSHLVRLDNLGAVETNAEILRTALAEHLASGRKVIMVSASSGGPTVALALEDPTLANHRALVGWLNICGVLQGSPVIDTFTPWPKSLLLRTIALFEGMNLDDLLSFSEAASRERFARFVAPPQLTIVNYIGIPFSGHAGIFDKGFYGILAKQGPNDGLTLIPDALAPGYTIMAIGSDHFINDDPQIEGKTAVLLSVMLQLLAEHSAQSAAKSRTPIKK
jgi:hypothetical protein